jgi:hypothetical protein
MPNPAPTPRDQEQLVALFHLMSPEDREAVLRDCRRIVLALFEREEAEARRPRLSLVHSSTAVAR